jgi:PAS domain S-box-containing protein
MQRTLERVTADRLVRLIFEGTASSTGEEFLHALVRSLAEALGTRYAFIAEFSPDLGTVNPLAVWDTDRFVEFDAWPTEGTPCADVLSGQVVLYASNLGAHFPSYTSDYASMGVDSFLAVPAIDAAGRVMGHLAVMHGEPIAASVEDMSVFRIFAARATAELERRRHIRALEASEQRLASILGTAMDAIITVDAERRIVLFNAAAERSLGCSADWAGGQPVDRFFSRPLRKRFDDYLQRLDASGVAASHLWAADGLTAQRANGEEFPVEGTLSCFEMDGQRHYTLILRDVNDRLEREREMARLELERDYFRERDAGRFGEIIGDSPAMRVVLEQLEPVASADTTVLVTGETGCGKELIAAALHAASPRKDKLLIKMNCAALPADLIESELFGHEKGAFTGATAQRKGRFELADGGTLFLDEVGELTAAAQAKLLRILQEQEFERVGGSRTLKVDVRVIAATNRDLGAMVTAGQFRADLYYRLNVFPLCVPPLRDRVEDIPLLAQHFLKFHARKLGKPLQGFTPDSLAAMQAYLWPGNIRELQNMIERACVLARGSLVAVELPRGSVDLRPARAADAVKTLGAAPGTGNATPEDDAASLEDVNREHILRTLAACDWKIEGRGGAAERLGLGASTLRFRMQKLGIRRPGSRSA